MTSSDHENLIAREKPNYDGAEPSGNSVAVLNLLRLEAYILDDRFRKRSEKALTAFLGTSSPNPLALSEMLLALDFYLDTCRQIIIITPQGRKTDAEPFLTEFRNQFIPNRTLTIVSEEELQSCSSIIPGIQEKSAIDGKTTAYVCKNGTCQLPAQDPRIFSGQLKCS